jgi:membrane-associated phospholipid phosphatase
MKQEATTIVGNTPLPTTPTVAQKRWYRIAFVLWLIAVLVLATASVIVHFHSVALVTIGYSRVFEGAHWITDVLAGYLSGAILLYALVACYLWAKRKLAQRQARAGHQREQGEHEDMLL